MESFCTSIYIARVSDLPTTSKAKSFLVSKLLLGQGLFQGLPIVLRHASVLNGIRCLVHHLGKTDVPLENHAS